MPRKEYRSAIRSRRLIREAFFQLLQEKPFERITVTEIVNRADINRSTFYAHYPDIWAVVDEIQKEALDSAMGVLNELKYVTILQDPMPFLQILSKPLEENQELFRQLGKTHYAQQQLENIKRMFITHTMQSPGIPEDLRGSRAFAVRISFFIGGIINVYQQWIQSELDCSIDEISGEIATMIRKTAPDILSTD